MTATIEIPMNTLTAEQAMAEALAEEMRLDSRVIAFGEGVSC